MGKLKQRWGIESNWDIFFIIIAFSINGSFASYIAKPLTETIGLDYETTNPWVFWPVRVILIFVVYQTTLPIVGWCVGQFNFFWGMEKKMLKRMGFKRFFKEEDTSN